MARNRALDWTNDFSISSFLFVDKLSIVHTFKTSLCFFSIEFYCVTWFILLPI